MPTEYICNKCGTIFKKNTCPCSPEEPPRCICDGTIDDPADVDCPRHGRPYKFRDPIIITVEGGVIQDISNIPKGQRIEVWDFDTDESEGDNICETPEGDTFFKAIYEGPGG